MVWSTYVFVQCGEKVVMRSRIGFGVVWIVFMCSMGSPVGRATKDPTHNMPGQCSGAYDDVGPVLVMHVSHVGAASLLTLTCFLSRCGQEPRAGELH